MHSEIVNTISFQSIDSALLEKTLKNVISNIFVEFKKIDILPIYYIHESLGFNHAYSPTAEQFKLIPIYFDNARTEYLRPDNRNDTNIIIDHCISHITLQSNYRSLVATKYFNNNGLVAIQARLTNYVPQSKIIWEEKYLITQGDIVYDFRKVASVDPDE